jgi:periplasmic copper chaperone A
MRHLLGAALATAVVLPAAVSAEDAGAALAEAGGIRIEDGYARSAGPAARSAAAFLSITNTTDADDRLVAAESDAAEVVQLHSTVEADGIARMQHLAGGIAVPAHESVQLERGGMHVMFMGLTAPMQEGDPVALTLVFENAGPIAVRLPVDQERGQAGTGHGAGHEHPDGGH